MQQKTNLFILWFRIARVILHVLLGISICAIGLPFCSANTRKRLTKWWCRALLNCFNLQVKVLGLPPTEATEKTMFLANHISWADIHAINSVIPVRFIAKVEIKSWPIFGYLVSKSGTLFINRNIRRDAARIIDITTDSLNEKDNVCLFPEGTTTEGDEILPFKASIVQAAVNAKAQVWPLCIYYPDANGQPNKQMAYAGETTMPESMGAILKIKQPIVHLHFLEPMACEGKTRQAISKAAFAAINQAFQAQINR